MGQNIRLKQIYLEPAGCSRWERGEADIALVARPACAALAAVIAQHTGKPRRS